MTNRTLGWWLLVAFAIVGLAVTVPVVSAHGDEPTQEYETEADRMVADGETAGWAGWMDGHMADWMGPDAVDEMESDMGVTIDETTREMPSDDNTLAGLNERGYGC